MRCYTKFKLVCIVLIVLMLAIVSAANRLDDFCPRDLDAKRQGYPIIIKRKNSILYSGIKQIVADKEYVYVVYGSYGAVQVYDLTGNYQYSIAVSSQQNGRIRIAVQDGALYIRDKVNNIYIFRNGEFFDFVEKPAAGILGTVDFNANASDYEVRWGSIWNVSSDSEAYCLIKRPLWLAIHQSGLGFLIMVLMLMLAGLLFYKKAER